MSNSTVGFGIIGCGVVATYHINGVLSAEDAALIAVSDIVEEQARKFGEQYDVAWYTEYREMLKRPDIDVICLCVPSGLRAEIAEEVALAGKHIVVEKPIDTTIARADRIIRAADQANIKLMCIFQLRYGDAVNQAREAILAGKLGRIVLGSAYIKWWRPQEYYESSAWRGTWAMEGGGALMTQGIHTVDLLQWIMGPVKSVYARMDALVHDIEVEDTLVAVLTFENRALGTIESSTASHPGTPAKLEFCGDKGTIIIEADRIHTWAVQGMDAVASGEATDVAKAASDATRFGDIGHKKQIQEMVRVIQEDTEPMINGPEGRKAVELIEAIYRSAKTGQVVELPLNAIRNPKSEITQGGIRERNDQNRGHRLH